MRLQVAFRTTDDGTVHVCRDGGTHYDVIEAVCLARGWPARVLEDPDLVGVPGFVDPAGQFYTREAALQLARDAGLARPTAGADGMGLMSEDLQ